jgi:hypothetical protein
MIAEYREKLIELEVYAAVGRYLCAKIARHMALSKGSPEDEAKAAAYTRILARLG